MAVTVVQEPVMGDGLDDKGDIILDSQVILEVPTDQRVEQVCWSSLNN